MPSTATLTLYSTAYVHGAGLCVVTCPVVPGAPDRVVVRAKDGTVFELDRQHCHAPQAPRLVCSDGRRVEG